MKRTLYAGGIIMVLMFALVGCMLFDRDNPNSPTTPSLDAGQIVNCYDGEGSSEGYGVFTGTGYFVVNVPAAGDYVIEYKTIYGVFDVVFRAKGPRMMYIGLQAGDMLADAVVLPTTITVPATESELIGNVLVFLRPGLALGHIKKLYEITLLPQGINLFDPATLPSTIQPIFIIQNGNPFKGKGGQGIVVIELTYHVVYHAIPIVATHPASHVPNN